MPNLRRFAWMALVPLIVGLLWGVFALQQTFIAEHELARQAVEARQRSLSEFAQRHFNDELEAALRQASPAMNAALGDPLLEAADLYWRQGVTQLLPRAVVYADGGTAVEELLHAITRSDLPRTPIIAAACAADPSFAERLSLHDEFLAALRMGQRAKATRTFRQLLEQRLRHTIAPIHDISQWLVLLEQFSETGEPSPETMRGLLVDGLRGRGQARLGGLQQQLLARRRHFDRSDFLLLVRRLARLCGEHGVDQQSFLRQARRQPTEHPLASQVCATACLFRHADDRPGWRWYMQADGDRGLRAVRLNTDELLARARLHMRNVGLLQQDEDFAASPYGNRASPAAPLLSLGQMRITMESPVAEAATAAAGQRFWWKTVLSLSVVVLVAVIVALSVVLQRRREKLIQMRSDFVSTVSHELNTPVAAIRLMAETAERKLLKLGVSMDYPRKIVDAADRLNLMIDNILSFNRLEIADGAALAKEDVVLHDCIEELRLRAAPYLRVGARLKLEGVGDADVSLLANRQLLITAVANLVANAVKYNDNTEIIVTLAVELGPGGCMVRLLDNGVGFASAETESVFSAFVRGQGEHPGKKQGFGLGLAICSRVMAMHGGSIRIAETRTGVQDSGTTFELFFPSLA